MAQLTVITYTCKKMLGPIIKRDIHVILGYDTPNGVYSTKIGSYLMSNFVINLRSSCKSAHPP